MKNRTDIYQFDRQMDKYDEGVERLKTSKRNKAIIFRFKKYCIAQGLSKPRILKYKTLFYHLSNFTKKDFDRVKKADVEEIVSIMNEKDWTAETKYTMKTLLRRFYKWLYGDDEKYPSEVSWIKPKVKQNEKSLPSEGELLTDDDIKKALEWTMNLRDKALISSLYESGCRVGELSSLRIKDIEFDKYGTILKVTGKTGPRNVRVVSSTPHISNWINNHPKKKKKESYIWCCIESERKGERMEYDSIRMMIKKVFKRAGIKKKHNPHIFRHSRATFMANHMTEFQMNHYFGWVQGSGMPATYVHMSGKTVEDTILRLNGLESENSAKPKEQVKSCQRCETINSSESTYCSKCGCVIDSLTALRLEEENKKKNQFQEISAELVKRIMAEKPELVAGIMQEMTRMGQN